MLFLVCAELLQRADVAEERAAAAEADAALARQELASVRVSPLSSLQTQSHQARYWMCQAGLGMRVSTAVAEQLSAKHLACPRCNILYQHARGIQK